MSSKYKGVATPCLGVDKAGNSTPLTSVLKDETDGIVDEKPVKFEHYTFSNGKFLPCNTQANYMENIQQNIESTANNTFFLPIDSSPGQIVEVKTEETLPKWEHNYNKARTSPALVIQFEESDDEAKVEKNINPICNLVNNNSTTCPSEILSSNVSQVMCSSATSSNHGSVSSYIDAGVKIEPMSPGKLPPGKKVKTLRKTIVVPLGADVETATAKAIDSITADLNRRAAERLAHGRNVADEEETVVEITRIAPGEGYFSRDNVVKNTQPLEIENCKFDSSKCKQPRKCVQPVRIERTPSPVYVLNQFVTPGKLERTPSPAIQYFGEIKGDRLTPDHANSNSCVQFTAMKTPERICTAPALGTFQNTRGDTLTGLVTQTGTRSVDEDVKPIALHIEPLPSAVAAGVMPSSSGSNVSIQQFDDDTKNINIAIDSCPHDDSLTNIQWLGKMSGEKLRSSQRNVCVLTNEKQIEKVSRECGRKKRPPYSYMHLIQMAISSRSDKRMTLRQIYKWIEDKFPFYKYSAKPGWKNSIRHNLSLYNVFMRQKSNTPGHTGCSYWTLRQDVDPKSSKNFKCASSDSVTTMRSQSVVRGTGALQSISQSSPGMMWGNSQDGSSSIQKLTPRHRKGPAPLLPKLPALQAYALIPIQSGMPVLQTQPLVLQSWPVGSSTAPTATVVTSTNSMLSSQSADSSFNRSGTKRSGPMVLGSGPQRKQVKIAPKTMAPSASATLTSSGQLRSCSPATMASSLLTNNSLSLSSLAGNNSATVSMDTTDLNFQLSSIRMDSGIDTKSSSELSISDPPSSQERPKLPAGLPRPKMYRHKKPRKEVHQIRPDDKSPESLNGSGEKKLNRHDKVLTLNDSSITDSSVQSLLACIQREFSSPMKLLLRTPPKAADKHRLTSTPTKGTPDSPSAWLSPIRGLTPLSTDGTFLDSGIFTPEDKLPTRPQSESTPGSKGSSNRSPRLGSLRDFGLPGLTPLKSPGKLFLAQSPNGSINLDNQSFTRLLGEIHLDSMVEEMGVDVANISWSVFNGETDT